MDRQNHNSQQSVTGGPVVLTDEEHQECTEFLRSLTQAEDGEYVIKDDVADSFIRNITALCLMGRAERLANYAGADAVSMTFHIPHFGFLTSDLAEEACKTAAKACAVFPAFVYFYDFGCILLQVGKYDEAKVAFREFLRLNRIQIADEVMKIAVSNRDTSEMIEHAQRLI